MIKSTLVQVRLVRDIRLCRSTVFDCMQITQFHRRWRTTKNKNSYSLLVRSSHLHLACIPWSLICRDPNSGNMYILYTYMQWRRQTSVVWLIVCVVMGFPCMPPLLQSRWSAQHANKCASRCVAAHRIIDEPWPRGAFRQVQMRMGAWAQTNHRAPSSSRVGGRAAVPNGNCFTVLWIRARTIVSLAIVPKHMC